MEPSAKAAERLAGVQNHVNPTASKQAAIEDVYIISAARTPTARFNGSFANIPAPQLGAYAIKEALRKSNVPASRITNVYMGNVLQAGIGQSPARQAAISAGLPVTVDAVTVNKVCASGLKAAVIAAQDISLGMADAQVAGGMENMSRAPYYLPRGSSGGGRGTGDLKLQDGLVKDGLWDVYNQFHMGSCAENTAAKLGVSREAQDEYAIQSYLRAQAAWAEGKFKDEVVPVAVTDQITRTNDEGYDRLRRDKVATLKPAFTKDGTGTVTAANSSSLNDGASALVLGNRAIAQQYGKGSRVLSKLVASADAAVEPIDFPIAPAKAIELALARAGIQKQDVAVWELNEAFAAVIKANAQVRLPFPS